MGKGIGLGKVILFGEHFAVYGVPVIISAISLTTVATVKKIKREGVLINDGREGTPGYIEEKKQMQIESIERMFKKLGLSSLDVEITLGGKLPAFSGIGASAASSVAIARAISSEFGLKLTDDEVNAAAFEAEQAYHGEKTVGVDNIAATYGGLIWFEKGEPPKIERIKLKRPVEIVIGNTGIVANTKEMLEGVAQRRKKDPIKYNRIIEDAKDVVYKGREALERFDLRTVGSLMDMNHTLLQGIGTSCKEIDFLTNLAKKHGAYGAKQTGSGGGGCIAVLTPGKELQNKIADIIRNEGFEAIKTKI
ncbi:MAG: mevalonate kinase [candidate division Zixibacteria bacterium]|nr:mevalonate kinase [candidate division Zixibacteria bacterium]